MKVLFTLIWLMAFSSLEATIHVIGDSHSQEFSSIQECKIHYLGPRTMHRVGRDGLDLVNFKALGIQEGDVVVLAFGEIDVRCHIGKQRDFFHRNLEEVVHTLLDNYFCTISRNIAFYNNIHVVVYTVTPPIQSASNVGYESYGSAEDRVWITKMLNQNLIQKAKAMGLGVIDVYDDYADAKGLLLAEYSDTSVHIHPNCNHAIRQQLFTLFPTQAFPKK